MTSQDLRAQVAEKIARRTGANLDVLRADTPFADLGLDSLAVLEIGFMLEEEFKIEFEGVNAQNLPRHVSDLARLVEVHLARPRA